MAETNQFEHLIYRFERIAEDHTATIQRIRSSELIDSAKQRDIATIRAGAHDTVRSTIKGAVEELDRKLAKQEALKQAARDVQRETREKAGEPARTHQATYESKLSGLRPDQIADTLIRWRGEARTTAETMALRNVARPALHRVIDNHMLQDTVRMHARAVLSNVDVDEDRADLPAEHEEAEKAIESIKMQWIGVESAARSAMNATGNDWRNEGSNWLEIAKAAQREYRGPFASTDPDPRYTPSTRMTQEPPSAFAGVV